MVDKLDFLKRIQSEKIFFQFLACIYSIKSENLILICLSMKEYMIIKSIIANHFHYQSHRFSNCLFWLARWL